MKKVIISFVTTIFTLLSWSGVSQDSKQEISNEIREKLAGFIDLESKGSFGDLNPKAPSETAQLSKLIGFWKTENEGFFQGKWYPGGNTYWVFKYVSDGFAIQDMWLQPADQLPPPMRHIQRDNVIMNSRIYDPNNKEWKTLWIDNFMNTAGSFTGSFKDGIITFNSDQNEMRVVFHSMKDETFEWYWELKQDGEWRKLGRLKATRIKI